MEKIIGDESKLLVFENINKFYGSNPALNNVSFELPKGKIVGLLGPNGSGKTTMIKIINGLIQPTSGNVLIHGKIPGVESKRIISYLPDTTYLNDWMKVKDIVKYFADFYDDFDETRANSMIDKLSIDRMAKLKTLSKGTKEKVQLVLVMSRKAKLYILDEPIAGVDPAARDFIMDTILTNYLDSESTLLISTHLINDVERILEEAIFLKNGQVFRYCSVDDIISETGNSVDHYFREVFKC